MELKVESKVGSIQGSQEKIYMFLSDFTNFKSFIPADKIKNFEATADQCTFEADTIGKTGMQIIEKEPCKLIKVTGLNTTKDFFFWIQLKEVTATDTRIKVTIKAELNMMMKMMAEKPLKKFADALVDKLSEMRF